MAYMLRSLIYLSLLLAPLLTPADTTPAGFALTDSYPLADRSLLLRDAGVRIVFVDVYVGALCLPDRSGAAQRILTTPDPRSMHRCMLYKEVPAAKIARGWRDGFGANLDPAAFIQLQQRLETSNALFPNLQHGDVARRDYVTNQGTRLSVNGEARGRIEADVFFTSLKQAWIDERAADADLKQDLPGQG